MNIQNIPPVPELEPESEEVLQAKHLLKTNGYLLFPYRRSAQSFCRLFRVLGRQITSLSNSTREKPQHSAVVAGVLSSDGFTREPSTVPSQCCERCGAELAQGARFYRKCGTPTAQLTPATPESQTETSVLEPDSSENTLTTEVSQLSAERCPACGTELTQGVRFCRKCGISVAHE